MMVRLNKIREGCANHELRDYRENDVIEVELLEPKYKGRVKDVITEVVFFIGEYEEIK